MLLGLGYLYVYIYIYIYIYIFCQKVENNRLYSWAKFCNINSFLLLKVVSVECVDQQINFVLP